MTTSLLLLRKTIAPGATQRNAVLARPAPADESRDLASRSLLGEKVNVGEGSCLAPHRIRLVQDVPNNRMPDPKFLPGRRHAEAAVAYVFSNFYSNFWLIFGKL